MAEEEQITISIDRTEAKAIVAHLETHDLSPVTIGFMALLNRALGRPEPVYEVVPLTRWQRACYLWCPAVLLILGALATAAVPWEHGRYAWPVFHLVQWFGIGILAVGLVGAVVCAVRDTFIDGMKGMKSGLILAMFAGIFWVTFSALWTVVLAGNLN
jgi:hypothetical protein